MEIFVEKVKSIFSVPLWSASWLVEGDLNLIIFCIFSLDAGMFPLPW